MLGSNLKTPKADRFLNNLMVVENKKVKATFDVNGAEHILNLNAKLTGRGITLTTNIFFKAAVIIMCDIFQSY